MQDSLATLQMQDIYQQIAVQQYSIPLGDVMLYQTMLLRSPPNTIHLEFLIQAKFNAITSIHHGHFTNSFGLMALTLVPI